jgi:hypothetical protein
VWMLSSTGELLPGLPETELASDRPLRFSIWQMAGNLLGRYRFSVSLSR